jgi:hypothetical protein
MATDGVIELVLQQSVPGNRAQQESSLLFLSFFATPLYLARGLYNGNEGPWL